MHANEEEKPVQVSKEEVLAEGHQVVQRRVDGVVIQVQKPLQRQKNQAVNGPIQQQFQVRKLRIVQLGWAKAPVIGHVDTLLCPVR